MIEADSTAISKEFAPNSIQTIRRSLLRGAMLRAFGFSFSGIERVTGGFDLLGKQRTSVAFGDLSGPLVIERTSGFAAIVLPAKDRAPFKIVGLNSAHAARFVSAANDAFAEYVRRQYNSIEDELLTLAEAMSRLEQPRRYPAACLLRPFVERAKIAAEGLPISMPDGALTADQMNVLGKALLLLQSPQTTRQVAVQAFLDSELSEMKVFFDEIESKPLTPEQRLAVVTDEDATLILAGAGSGKTSVIVGKAAYLITKSIREPKQVLLLAFGKDAASEMASRIRERSGSNVDAFTFHALGNKIIREVEGRAPPLAAHANDDAQFRLLLRDILIHDVAQNAGLGGVILEWFSEFYWPYKNEWDFKTKDEYFQWVEAHELRTLNGELVKSFEEWEIANWLYRNGVEYEYEPIYKHPLPDDARGAYRPDFRLAKSGIYIEHFGVRKSFNPDGSINFTTAPYIDNARYLADMEWKRRLHHNNGTVLVETFSYEKIEGRLLESLEEKLAPHVDFEPISQNLIFAALSELGQVDAFTLTLGTFLRHYKSSGASIDQCRLRSDDAQDKGRTRAFMRVFEPFFNAYQERLGDQIDFEDMINRATEHVETGRYQSPYRHLLVDEFQDISEGRARLLRALKAQHADARLFAVGDDWQSIFRFAGADTRLMRDFGSEFGGMLGAEHGIHSVVDLGRTFRSVDKIAVPARRFVLQNPSQIEKQVSTTKQSEAPAIMVAYCERAQEEAALKARLEAISSSASETTSILLIARYNHLRPKALRSLQGEFPKLTLRFFTAHGSKGLEADHVLILRAASGVMGFPSEIADDPVLNLVLPKPEAYEHAEERRLFYVALTRARRSVTILADRDQPSSFVRELVDHPEYETIEIEERDILERRCSACGGGVLAKRGENNKLFYACEHRGLCGKILRPCSSCGADLPVTSRNNPGMLLCSCGAELPKCPSCDDGWLVERSGQYGKFLGCVRFPECKGTRQIS